MSLTELLSSSMFGAGIMEYLSLVYFFIYIYIYIYIGSQWCYCCTHSIEYILTRGAIRYDAPVKACPTKDNIYVEIDIMLILRLGENHRDVKNFIYKLGARRLDSLLKNESQESIRNFARLHKHYEVPDLKSELSATLITGLNEKFNQFGVHFEHVAITAIKLPQEIERTFADTTLYDIKLQKQIKQYGIYIYIYI